MARKQHRVDEVLRSLYHKNGVRISNKEIEVLKDQNDLGNGSWGKIDFLCHYQGYSLYMVKRFS